MDYQMLRQVFTMWLSLFRQLLSSSSTAGPSPRSHLLSGGNDAASGEESLPSLCSWVTAFMLLVFSAQLDMFVPKPQSWSGGKKKDAGVPELHYVMVDLRSKPITEEQDEFHGNNAGKILRFPQKRPEGFTAAATLIRCIRGMTLRVYFLNLYLLCHLKPVGQPKSAAYCTGAGGD